MHLCCHMLFLLEQCMTLGSQLEHQLSDMLGPTRHQACLKIVICVAMEPYCGFTCFWMSVACSSLIARASFVVLHGTGFSCA